MVLYTIPNQYYWCRCCIVNCPPRENDPSTVYNTTSVLYGLRNEKCEMNIILHFHFMSVQIEVRLVDTDINCM